MSLRELICRELANCDATPYYVGGCVRDEILGLEPKDFDIEVFNISPNQLRDVLSRFGTVNEVGVSFGVMKVRTPEGEIDFSLPRRDNRLAVGHRGFMVQVDPTMTVAEAAGRRDFTINSIYKDAVTGEIIDYYEGVSHVRSKRLVAVSQHFEEDPLRVLRGMQFASRFDMDVAKYGDTSYMCGCMGNEYRHLATERVGEEWRKWTKGDYPSKGLLFLKKVGWLNFYPDIVNLIGVPQDPHFHPEGDVYIHTTYVCDAMARICTREGVNGEDREVLMFAALTHDFGKATTTTFDGNPPRYRSRGHAEAGVPMARGFLKSIGIFDRVIERVLPLVREHMFPTWEEQTRRTVRRLKVRLGVATLEELLLLMESDTSGRPPYPAGKAEGDEMMRTLAAELPPKIEPILTGRHIIEAGVREGKEIGRIKQLAFEGQLGEEFMDETGAIEWLNNYLHSQEQNNVIPEHQDCPKSEVHNG